MFDNPRNSLRRIEDELLDEELESILYDDVDDDESEQEYRPPRIRRGKPQDFSRAVYEDEDEDDDEDRYMILPKKKGIKGLVFLAVLEILAILAVLGWWLQWLI